MIRAALAVFGLSLGCTDGAALDSAAADRSGLGSDSASQQTGSETDAGFATDGGTEARGTAAISGLVHGPDGAPAQDVRVTLCHALCRYVDTDSSGAFAFTQQDANSYALDLQTFDPDRNWAHMLVFVTLAEGEQRVESTPFTMATLGAATTVSAAGEVAVSDDLWLTVDPQAMTLPLGADTLVLAGVRATDLPPDLPDGDVLAAWYLSPFDATSAPGMTARATNSWGLEPGAQATLWAASYGDYAWVPAGSLTVSEDAGQLLGGDIPVLSTLVLVR